MRALEKNATVPAETEFSEYPTGIHAPFYSSWESLTPAMRRGVPILMYHKVAWPKNPLAYRDIRLHVSPQLFQSQLAELHAARVKSTSLTSFATEGKQSENEIVLTFDDGYAATLRNVVAPLAGHGFRGIAYLVAGQIGGFNVWEAGTGHSKERLADEALISEWIAAGHNIGSHAVSHKSLISLPDAQCKEEITSSKKILEDMFGVAVPHFSYPYGHYNQRIQNIVNEAGYESGVITDWGSNGGSANRMCLKRLHVRHLEADAPTWIRLLLRRV